jgi:tetratricopeptide (TPR) repeat protein
MKNLLSRIEYIFKFSLAGFWLFFNRVDKALLIFENLLLKYPNDPPVLATMGRFLVEQGDVEKGVHILKKSLKWIQKENRHLSEVYAYLGYGSLVLKSYQEAVKYNTLALENFDKSYTDFKQEQIYINLGLSYEGDQRLHDAVEAYNKGLNISPKNISLLKKLARAYCQMGKELEARQHLIELLSIDPSLRNDENIQELCGLVGIIH